MLTIAADNAVLFVRANHLCGLLCKAQRRVALNEPASLHVLPIGVEAWIDGEAWVEVLLGVMHQELQNNEDLVSR